MLADKAGWFAQFRRESAVPANWDDDEAYSRIRQSFPRDGRREQGLRQQRRCDEPFESRRRELSRKACYGEEAARENQTR